MIYSQSFFRFATGYVVFARSKDTPRTGPPISVEMGPSTMPWMALPSGCIAGSRRAWRHLFSTSWQSFVARGAPPIHFGRGDGVERTLLRVSCQSETFLVSPWQRGIDIRVLWHIGCQSEFDECRFVR